MGIIRDEFWGSGQQVRGVLNNMKNEKKESKKEIDLACLSVGII